MEVVYGAVVCLFGQFLFATSQPIILRLCDPELTEMWPALPKSCTSSITLNAQATMKNGHRNQALTCAAHLAVDIEQVKVAIEQSQRSDFRHHAWSDHASFTFHFHSPCW